MSDGVAVIRALLVASGPVTAIAPPERIAAGILPEFTALGALSITRVSVVDRNILKPGTYRHVTERVQVTAMAASYPDLRALLAAVKAAAADYIGAIAGLVNVTVQTGGAGPDFADEQSSIVQGSQDFLVGYTETR